MIFSRRIGRFSLDRLALIITAIAAVVLTARVWLHENPQHDPGAPLNLNDPPGWATQGKLVALRADPEECRAVMDRSGGAFTLLDETGEGACRRPDRLVLDDEPLSPSPAIATCPVAAGFALWMRRSVQHTAEAIYGSPVVRIDHLGTYNCRRINGASTGQWSEPVRVGTLPGALTYRHDIDSDDWTQNVAVSLIQEIRNRQNEIRRAEFVPTSSDHTWLPPDAERIELDDSGPLCRHSGAQLRAHDRVGIRAVRGTKIMSQLMDQHLETVIAGCVLCHIGHHNVTSQRRT